MTEGIRKPERAPRPSEVADRERWEQLVTSSLERTQSAAERWRTGLVGFITLITGALILKGPESTADLAENWLAVLTVLAGTGLAAAIGGLWLSLRAAAGAPSEARYEDIARIYGGIQQFEIQAARRSAKSLSQAKAMVLLSLLLLGTTPFVLWWAPTTASPELRLRASAEGVEICAHDLGKLPEDGADAENAGIRISGVAEISVVLDC